MKETTKAKAGKKASKSDKKKQPKSAPKEKAATKKPAAKSSSRKAPEKKAPAKAGGKASAGKSVADKKPSQAKSSPKKAPATKAPAKKAPAQIAGKHAGSKPAGGKTASSGKIAAAKRTAEKRAQPAKAAPKSPASSRAAKESGAMNSGTTKVSDKAAKRTPTVVAKKIAKAAKPATKAGKSAAKAAATGAGHRAPVAKLPFASYKGTRPYIFVSYSHKDMTEVFGIIKKLNDSRYRLWYDEGIEPGFEWPEVVGKAITGCSQLVVFMSRSAASSRNVRNEINLGFSENKGIIVVYLEKTKLTEGMKLQIGTVQFLNKYEMNGKETVEKLKSVLSNDLHN